MRNALSKIEKKHPELLQLKAHELTLVAHLFCYLRGRFRDYSVDMEYNRQGSEGVPKKLKGRRVRPDLIVHVRGNDKGNLLVVECKKSNWNRTDKKENIARLKKFRQEKGYTHAAFVVLKSDGSKICWVEPSHDSVG